MNSAILLISCPDSKGITAGVTDFIYSHNGNIEHADQHIDSQTNTFFMRIEWSLKDFRISKDKISKEFRPLSEKFKMTWNLYFSDELPRIAIFASRNTHCLYDLLLKHKSGQFNCTIPLIISNHAPAEKIAGIFNIRFAKMEKNLGNREELEKKEIALLEEEQIELIVLARYMQIFTNKFVNKFSNRIINIHHSFLPAFSGKNPYQQAYSRGVKIIGATSHYITDELDSGPIIEQDTVRVSHRDSLKDLKREGEELEKIVLSRALRWHIERKILVYNNKTVIFD